MNAFCAFRLNRKLKREKKSIDEELASLRRFLKEQSKEIGISMKASEIPDQEILKTLNMRFDVSDFEDVSDFLNAANIRKQNKETDIQEK